MLSHPVADPEGGGGGNAALPPSHPAMPPIQSDSQAVNFEFDIIRKKCILCGQLILRKISKIGVTRCQILKLKCTKFDFLCAPPQTPPGEFTALPRPQLYLRGLLLREGRQRRGGEGRGREGGRGRKGRGGLPPVGHSRSANGLTSSGRCLSNGK